MNNFEATILINPDLTENSLKKEIESFKEIVNNIKGSIINHENWGLRDLSYKIKNNKKAFYNFFQLELDGSKIESLQNNLNQNEKILRYLFVKVNNHQQLPTKMQNEEK
tara:strand:- start:491 stop:817 length:327 start_codon:yes stop_codon:yes gene_type:complete